AERPLEPVAADRRIEAGERPAAQPCAPTGQRPPEGKATIGQGDHPIELVGRPDPPASGAGPLRLSYAVPSLSVAGTSVGVTSASGASGSAASGGLASSASSMRTSFARPGDSAFITNSLGSSENGTMSTFSPRSSFTTMRTRAPRAPTHAPTGSTLLSLDHTAILVR